MTRATVFAMTHRGVVRRNNEDGVMVLDRSTGSLIATDGAAAVDLALHPLVLAVSDGMGGENAGEIASALTLEAVRAKLDSGPDGDVEVLTSAISHANDVVCAEAVANLDCRGMGATLVALVLNGDCARVAVVGDSRAYVLRRGCLAPLTRDQTFVQSLLDAGVLTPEQARTFPQKAVILQAIGTSEPPEPAILEMPLRRGDRLLVCSDGLTNELAEERIAEILRAHECPAATCRTLVAEANANGGRDNVSVIVAFVDGEDLPPPSRDDVPPPPPSSGHFVAARARPLP